MAIETEVTEQGELSTYDASMITARSLLNTVGRQIADGYKISAYEMLVAAQAHTAIAQAEASRPRWAQIGSHVINLAQVAYIDLFGTDLDGKPACIVYFSATSPDCHMMIVFRGDEYEHAVIRLSEALYGCMIDTEPPDADTDA